MPKTVRHSFNGGEVSPLVYGRRDIVQNASSCKQAQNCILRAQGPAMKIPGTQFLNEVKTSSSETCLIPFSIARTLNYHIELGNLYLRFYKDFVRLGAPLELTSPYTAAQVKDVHFDSTGKIMYLVHGSHQPRKLVRGDTDTDWTISKMVNKNGPFREINLDETLTITPSFPAWATATSYLVGDVRRVDDASQNINSTAPKDAVDKGAGLVGIPVNAHGYSTGDIVIIANSINYDGTYEVHDTSSTNEVVIVAPFVAEDFSAGGTETITRTVYYKSLTNHTSGGSHPTPPGNTTDWKVAPTYTGTGCTLTSSSALFQSGHVGALFRLQHPRKDAGISGDYNSITASQSILVSKGTEWTFNAFGTYSGVIEVQRSFDDEATWETVSHHRNTNVSRSFTATGEEVDANVLYRIAMTERSAGNVGWEFNIKEFRYKGIVEITGYTSSTVVTAKVIEAIGNVIATDEWEEGSWSDYRGWPETVAFHDGRLVFAKNSAEPEKKWRSKFDDFENFDDGTLDDDAIIQSVDGKGINEIQWLGSGEELLVATTGGIYRSSSNDRSEKITPTNATRRRQNSGAAINRQPILVDSSFLYISLDGKRIIDTHYDISQDVYTSRAEITRIAEHLTKDHTIIQLAIQNNPYRVIYALRSDGVILAALYHPEIETLGFSRLVTDGTVESISITPSTGEDQVMMVVKRTINSVTKRYIEYQKSFALPSAPKNYWYLHSAITSALVSAKTITGITQASATPSHIRKTPALKIGTPSTKQVWPKILLSFA